MSKNTTERRLSNKQTYVFVGKNTVDTETQFYLSLTFHFTAYTIGMENVHNFSDHSLPTSHNLCP
jgi:hypothetical protein